MQSNKPDPEAEEANLAKFRDAVANDPTVPFILEDQQMISVEQLNDASHGLKVHGGNCALWSSYAHPTEEGVTGDWRQDIVLFGSPGGGLGPFKAVFSKDGWAWVDNMGDMRLGTAFGFKEGQTMNEELAEKIKGYEGPLYAQVTGPWPASKAVQIANVMTDANRKEQEFVNELTEKFNSWDIQCHGGLSEKVGYLTRADFDMFEGLTETFRTVTWPGLKAGSSDDPLVAVQVAGLDFGERWCRWKFGTWVQLEKVLDAIIGLEGDAKLSLDDLLRLSKAA
jgi:hypothetical protein